ncbi:AAA family ATPase [Hymenobacter sp. YC55]|uniref:McrB family protein n=1 Tax=Hymenobacter sp. YC55 TaxID=3034019 RepID=UPI0023FA328B|nr:AAA family ATPase [Hymenobacter sp. YC55]MDF7812854.1 AAA family ATPase [Hymenobacter sp. YC55]
MTYTELQPSYTEVQIAVYKALLCRHSDDPSFTFSVRRSDFADEVNKGLFIGTKKSRYFAFTLWGIPVNDGSATGDLLDYVVGWNRDGTMRTYLHYQLANTAVGKQNTSNLVFGAALQRQNIQWNSSAPQARIQRLTYISASTLNSTDEVVNELLALIDTTAPLVDAAVSETYISELEWIAGRLAQDEFENNLIRLKAKRANWLNGYAPSSGATPPVTTDTITTVKPVMPQTPLNQILYGPPGTGKTYHTMVRTVAILEGISDAELELQFPPEKRAELRKKFDGYLHSSRIAFVTFHQAFTYEDFVEGIKPVLPISHTNSLQLEEDSGEFEPQHMVKAPAEAMQYAVRKGIFRQMCETARTYAYDRRRQPSSIPFDDLYASFLDYLNERTSTTSGPVLLPTKSHSEVELADIEKHTGRLSFRYPKGKDDEGPYHVDKFRIQKLYELYSSIGEIGNLQQDISDKVGGSHQTLLWVAFNALKDYENYQSANSNHGSSSDSGAPFVLIIDEINRGNIANIFGELITLLEDDKRAGRPEGLTVVLPYSQEQFSVPANLYVLGTMNTADRSVEALDTALRRRFSFTEMLPRPELLSPHQIIVRLWCQKKHENCGWDEEPYLSAETELYELLGCQSLAQQNQELFWQQVQQHGATPDITAELLLNIPLTGIDLEKLLRAINARLEQLLDFDHIIGHALLIHVFSLEELREAFQQKILPLLQEYFFGDWGKIGLVLGSAFIRQVNQNQINSGYKLMPFGSYSISELSEKPVYKLTDVRTLDAHAFKSIYA